MSNRSLVIPFMFVRHNISIPNNSRTVIEKKDFVISNSFSTNKIEYKRTEETILTTDVKNLIAAVNVIYEQTKNMNIEQKKTFYRITNESVSGINIKISDIRKKRSLPKGGTTYRQIKSSLLKFKNLSITANRFCYSAKDTEEKETVFSFINQISTDTENENSIWIKPNSLIVRGILGVSDFPFIVDQYIFNKLSGIHLNIYMYIKSHTVKNPSEISFTLNNLIKNSNYLYSKSGMNRPNEGKIKIKRALEKLVSLNEISGWLLSKNSKNEDKVTIYFEKQVVGFQA